MKTLRFLFSLLLFTQVSYSWSGVIPLPNLPDAPTIEAFIELHKMTAREERNALARITSSNALTNQIKKHTANFKEAREVLDNRTAHLYSYALFAARLFYLGKSIKGFMASYNAFTSFSTSTMFKKPQAAWYYADALSACYRQVKPLRETMRNMALIGTFGEATMQERLDMITNLQMTVDKCRHIIDEAYLWASIAVSGGFTRIFLDDLFNSQFTENLGKSILSLYYQDL